MNTSKQINIMVALVFIAVLATGAYTMWDPDRASDAQKSELGKTVERGAFLFAQNCIVCHGNAAEGGAAGNRLKQAPALNRKDLQGFDPKTNTVSAQDKATQFKFVVNTITCGRIGKAMPTWGQAQGGTLNDEQIRQLATMITEGTGWPATREFAIAGDHKHHYTGYSSAGVTLSKALSASDTTVYISNVDLTGKGSRLEIGSDEKNEKVIGELLLVTDVLKSIIVERGSSATSHDAKSAIAGPDGVIVGLFVSKALDDSATEVFVNNTSKLKAGEAIKIGDESVTIKEVTEPRVTVTRHIGTTKSAAHAEGAAVWLAPVPPDPAPVTQPACGQNLPAAVPTPGAVAPSATLKITAQGTAWDTEKLVGIVGQELTLTYENKDAGTAHNIHIFKNKDASGDAVIQSDVAPGPEALTLKFGPLDAGDYYYQCDIHPGQMSGTLSVVAAGSAPAASSSPAASTTPEASAAP